MNVRLSILYMSLVFAGVLSCKHSGPSDIRQDAGNPDADKYVVTRLENPILQFNAADPSLLDDRERTGYYYLYTTGDGNYDIPVYRSKNLIDWELLGDAFPDGYRRNWGESWAGIWAPDINYIDGRYVLYYSLGCWNEPVLSESGAAVSDSPAGPFIDIEGNPLLNYENCSVFNPIDVDFFDDGEKKYIFWGSYKLSDNPDFDYGIYAIEVADDGLSIKEGAKKTKVAGNQLEGTNVAKKEGKYYLFASTGSTLAGASSTYRVVVGRSDSILGPYTGPDGSPMLDNDGYNNYIMSGDGVIFFGTGHNSGLVYDDAGQSWMAYHSLWIGTGSLDVRCLCIDKVKWLGDWPRMETGHPVRGGEGPKFISSEISPSSRQDLKRRQP